MQENDTPQIENTEFTTTGAVYKPLHVERQVKIYPIQEHELDNLSVLTNESTLWTSVGASALVLFLSALWDIFTATEINNKPAMVLAVLYIAVSLISFWRASGYVSQRKRQLQKILNEVTK